jgi:hypothetical protein
MNVWPTGSYDESLEAIAVMLVGYACKDTGGVTGFGPEPCYDFLFWN